MHGLAKQVILSRWPKAAFSPLALFAAGEQGIWFDPSDLSTVFQDAVGTTPGAVDAVVGLVLDKSKGLARGAELVANGDFAAGTTGWTATNGTISSVGGRLRHTSTGAAQNTRAYAAITCVVGRWYKVTGTIAANSSGASVNFSVGNGAGFTSIANGPSGTGLRTDTFYFLAQQTTQYVYSAATQDTGQYIEIDDISVREIAGNHAYQATTASKPILRQAGGLYYLEFDGTDDFLQTGSIDFSATDKVGLFAGVRKISDAASGMLAELSANAGSNAGSFRMTPANPANTYTWVSGGSVAGAAVATSATTYVPPVTNVITGLADISGDSAVLRVNGAQVASSVTDQGTGNFGNYPLYIGRRAGSSVPFNGRLYALIARGAASSAAQIAAAEAWMNGKTGAY